MIITVKIYGILFGPQGSGCQFIVEAIDIKKLLFSNDNKSSLKLLTYISCIDILWESIQQLNRVFFNEKEIPFNTDDTIFQHKLFQTTDNNYFKTIRACFAAHPVNLHDNFAGKGEKEKKYASWSSSDFGQSKFAVLLYSAKLDIGPVFLDINCDELQTFAEKRYDYLKILIEKVDNIINEYISKYQNIQIAKSDSLLSQIDILAKESKLRFDNDYCNLKLDKLRIIFGTYISNKQNRNIVDIYRKALKKEVDELYCALQKMRINKLSRDEENRIEYPPDCRYHFSKLSDAVLCGKDSPPIFINSYTKYLNGIVDLNNIATPKELYAVVNAGFYYYNNFGKK